MYNIRKLFKEVEMILENKRGIEKEFKCVMTYKNNKGLYVFYEHDDVIHVGKKVDDKLIPIEETEASIMTKLFNKIESIR